MTRNACPHCGHKLWSPPNKGKGRWQAMVRALKPGGRFPVADEEQRNAARNAARTLGIRVRTYTDWSNGTVYVERFSK